MTAKHEPDLGYFRVVVMGGETDGPLASVELCGLTCQRMADLGEARSRHSATRLVDGRLLVAGGHGPAGLLATTELFDVAGNFVRPALPLAAARAGHAATLLADGRVFLVGGEGQAGPLATAEIFDPRPDLATAPRPEITRWPRTVALGDGLALEGAGFRSPTAGSGGLGGQDSPSDHPLVELRSLVDGNRLYLLPAPGAGWSATSFLTTPLRTLPPGPARVTVVTQAAPSLSKVVLLNAPGSRGDGD